MAFGYRATDVKRTRDGCQVHIDGLGYFSPTLIVKGKVRPKIPLRDRNRMVHFKDISFRMDKELHESVGTPDLVMTRWEAHSQLSTREEREQRMTDYFSRHEFVTRRQLQFLLGLKKTVAVEQLRQWREAGLLLNKGSDRQPIYVPAPGCFGR